MCGKFSWGELLEFHTWRGDEEENVPVDGDLVVVQLVKDDNAVVVVTIIFFLLLLFFHFIIILREVDVFDFVFVNHRFVHCEQSQRYQNCGGEVDQGAGRHSKATQAHF